MYCIISANYVHVHQSPDYITASQLSFLTAHSNCKYSVVHLCDLMTTCTVLINTFLKIHSIILFSYLGMWASLFN